MCRQKTLFTSVYKASLLVLCIRKCKHEMDATVDDLFHPTGQTWTKRRMLQVDLSELDGKDNASSTPEPNWSDPCSPRLSDAVYVSNSSPKRGMQH